ncbi:hypothetical protein EDC94DRAFT_693032 [Helicostylum pulchrum]|uniref:GCS light chain n=1 Tax=Helicostylum pulchrum TaxID=562976 RepID=A0ABP9XKH4_9FUNG|nr:hypothetical protein EDC94DRAFT_693032 [Helicostylum pulchrum]
MPSQDYPKQVSVPEFKQLVLYTGNVMRNSIASGNHWNTKSNAELVQAISDTLDTSLYGSDKPSFRYYTESELLEVPDLRLTSRIRPEDRNDVEVTAKLFYLDRCNEYQVSHIDKAIHHLQQLLNVNSIDTFIVSFDTEESPAHIDKAWKDLEVYHENGVIRKLGVSDFDLVTLTEFLNKKDLKVKPSIDQVHVDKCCSLPKDLIELGKKHGVEMTFNGDTTEILTTEALSSLLNTHGLITDKTSVKPRWVLKYNVFFNCRSVVADKGYIVVGDVLN